MANQTTEASVSKRLKPSHIILPILFGFAGIVWMFCSEFSEIKDAEIPFEKYLNGYTVLFLFLALLAVAIRDLSGMGRLYLLSEKQLSFHSLFRIRMLYEFTSAITPSAAGGSTLEMLFIHKEGVKFGKSTAITIISLFFDELFFVIGFPILLLILPIDLLFAVEGTFSAAILSVFAIAYLSKVAWLVVLFIGIFIKPSTISWIIQKVFSLRILKRWRIGAYRTAIDVKECSRNMRHKSIVFWLKNLGYSVLMWVSRFTVVNFLIMAFNQSTESLMSFTTQFLILGRQLVLMVVMLVAPTPGASGFIEVLFNSYLGEFIPKGIVLLLITAIWRILIYYNYLLIGAVLAPRWINRNYSKKNKSVTK
ncbi:MAG: hypothetical protein BWY47_00855 [Bacteroidetes bacterium ADurb.Bin302]|nr:MAG: hypothetical protein BWY47_00855 [Bacteroidetes bacterium ADurb.Bin302]